MERVDRFLDKTAMWMLGNPDMASYPRHRLKTDLTMYRRSDRVTKVTRRQSKSSSQHRSEFEVAYGVVEENNREEEDQTVPAAIRYIQGLPNTHHSPPPTNEDPFRQSQGRLSSQCAPTDPDELCYTSSEEALPSSALRSPSLESMTQLQGEQYLCIYTRSGRSRRRREEHFNHGRSISPSTPLQPRSESRSGSPYSTLSSITQACLANYESRVSLEADHRQFSISSGFTQGSTLHDASEKHVIEREGFQRSNGLEVPDNEGANSRKTAIDGYIDRYQADERQKYYYDNYGNRRPHI